MAEGEDGLCLTVAEEEGHTDALDEEVERFIHVVGEGDGYFVVWSNRREVWDVMEAPRAIEVCVEEGLKEFNMAAEGVDGGRGMVVGV